MSWFSGQTWLWYLLAFVVGVLVAWLLFVLPAQRRLRALGGTPAARVTTPASPTGAGPADEEDTGSQHVLSHGRHDADDGPGAEVPERPEPEPWNARTQQLPAVDSALAVLDSGTGSFRLGLDRAASALFPDPPRPTGRVRPATSPNDTPTPRTGIPVVPPADGDGPSLFDDSTPQHPGRAPGHD